MKRYLLVLGVLLVLLLIPLKIGADVTSQDVTVTAVGYICEAPGGLTVTYISDYEIGISWEAGSGAENTMVRGAYGRPVEGRDDGFAVYYGNSTNTTLWTPNVGIVSPIYLRAWSESGGIWEETGATAEGDFMSKAILFIVVAVLALGMTLGFVWKRNGFFSYGAAGAWLLMGLLAFQESASPNPGQITDVYMGLFWLSVGFTITCGLLPLLMREKPELAEEAEGEWEGEDLSAFGFGGEKKQPEVRPRTPRPSKFGQTGRV